MNIARRIIISQRGFTLIELIVVIAITSIVIAAATGTVYQLLAGNSQNSNAMLATRNVQQAGHWISRDILMANEIDISGTDDPFTPNPSSSIDVLTVYWFEYKTYDLDAPPITSIKHKVTYSIHENGTLHRYYMVAPEAEHNNVFPGIDDTGWSLVNTQIIARYINQGAFNISEGISQYVLEITTDVSGFRPASESRVYNIKTRPG